MELHDTNSGATHEHQALYWNISIEWWNCIDRFIEIYKWNNWKPFFILWRSRIELWRSPAPPEMSDLGEIRLFLGQWKYIVIAVTVTWTSWHLRSPITWVLNQQFVRANVLETSEFTLLALCDANSIVTNGFSSQRASNSESVLRWWHHCASKNYKNDGPLR